MKQFLLLAILAIFAFVPQVSAQSLPDLPTPFDSDEQNEVIYRDESGAIHGLVISKPVDGQVTILNGQLAVTNSFAAPITFYLYVLTDNSWSADTSGLVQAYSSSTIDVIGLEFISSTYDIKDFSTGDLVFPLPEEGLHLLPGKLMEENKVGLVEKILAAMKIILLCGVSCLALLISLPILSKVFAIFQVK